jgi:hypothetical protein
MYLTQDGFILDMSTAPPPSYSLSLRGRPTTPPSTSANGLLIHSRMYALADYYNIPPLKNLSKTKFRKAAQTHWDSPEFGQAIEIIFTSTLYGDRGLRQVVKEIVQEHHSVMEKPEIESIMRESPDFAYDVLMSMLKKKVLLFESISCSNCKNYSSITGGAVMTVCRCGKFVNIGTVSKHQ